MPQRNNPDNKCVRGARRPDAAREANRARICSRFSTVMIGAHTACPMICPRCARRPANRAEHSICRSVGVCQCSALLVVGTPVVVSQDASDRRDSPARNRSTSTRMMAASVSRMVTLSSS